MNLRYRNWRTRRKMVRDYNRALKAVFKMRPDAEFVVHPYSDFNL